MSNTSVNQTPPEMPNNIPKGWITWITAGAGVIAFGILPALHQILPFIPALDVGSVTAALGLLFSVGFWAHGQGLKAVINYLQSNVLPMLLTDLLPILKDEMEKIIKVELDKQTKQLTNTDTTINK